MKIAYYLILLPTIILIAFSCAKVGGKCEEPIDIRYFSSLSFIFKDSRGNYLYSEQASLYNLDSLKITTASDSLVPLFYGEDNMPESSVKYKYVEISPIYSQSTDENSFNSEICKDYFIYFSFNDVDTVRVCFKSKYTACGSLFETFKVYYKGVLISSTDGILPQITLIKN